MQWSLEKVYKNRVRGKILQQPHLNVTGVLDEARVTIEFDDGKSDTYHLLNYIQNSKCLNYCTILEMMIKEIKGVYCIALLDNKGSIYICRDSYGVRPYVIGIKDNNICVIDHCLRNIMMRILI